MVETSVRGQDLSLECAKKSATQKILTTGLVALHLIHAMKVKVTATPMLIALVSWSVDLATALKG